MNSFIPQFFPAAWKTEHQIYGVDFTEDVCLGFVIRNESSYSCLMEIEVKEQGIDTNTLLDAALTKLSEMKNNVQIKIARPEGATVIWLEAEDNFISVRLLLPKVQEFIKKEIGETFLFTIPSRDLLLIWNESAPNSITEKHKKEAIEDFNNEEYSLSPKVFIYSSVWPCKTFR